MSQTTPAIEVQDLTKRYAPPYSALLAVDHINFQVEQGEVCGKIQSRKWIGKLVSPVSGEIVELNEDMEEDTSLINSDPYGKGWILVIEASDLESELGNLIHGDAVADFIEREIKRAEEEKAKGS